MPTAYSYVRFSTPAQAEGDSLRRQTEAAADWCRRNGVHLDTTTTLHDLGRSAFTGSHRTNADRHALASFLKMVEQGRVQRGDYLVIEALDRLSREHVRPALSLLLSLIEAGVRVVQLKPTEAIYDEKAEPMMLMMAIMELARGHSESAMKSVRVSAAWQQRKKAAREQGRTLTRKLPSWIEERDGERVLIPERAAVVRRIFELAASGYGAPAIVGVLTGEGVPAFGPSGKWCKATVAKILRGRQAVGELQPCVNRQPDGPPVPGFFPAVVTEDEWLAAQAGIADRRKSKCRATRHVNVFAGLLHDALDGGTMFATTRQVWGKPVRSLMNSEADEGRAPARTFPLDTFERAVLSLLREVDPADILGTDGTPDPVAVLAGEMAGIDTRIAELEEELAEGDVQALARALRKLEGRRQELAARLAEARRQAASPLGEAWGEARTLLAALDAAPDPRDARLRLRSVLRRVVEEIWVVVVDRGRRRLAAVQMRFTGGARRDYLILHRYEFSNGTHRIPSGWQAVSLPADSLPALDLRNREHAAALAEHLAVLDLAQTFPD